jgi:hypothetical protein
MAISLNISAPGAIPDLDTLKATVNDWLDRDDLADKVPVFIQMAEAMFNRELRTPEMESTTIGEATSEDTTLPEDYLGMRSIYEEGSPDRPLKAISPTAIRQGYDGATGIPVAYTLISGGIRLIPPPSDTILLTMDYWARIEPLSVYSPSNWLLRKHPDAYLYGTLFHAECHLDNAPRAQQWKLLLDEVLQRVNQSGAQRPVRRGTIGSIDDCTGSRQGQVLKEIPFGEFTPDVAPSHSNALDTKRRTSYRSSNGFAPGRFVPAPSQRRLARSSSEAAAFIGSDGNSTLLSATPAKLSKYSGSWSDIQSRLSTTSRWHFAQFGDNVVYANGGPLGPLSN